MYTVLGIYRILIDGRLSLYEHQSTKNPNLPLRFLFYISHLYSRLTVKENLYGETRVQIPAPEFLIFYNGRDKIRAYTEEMELPEAVDRAIDECIREDVLRDFLMEYRAEARPMSIFEYDQERHM